MDTTKPAQSFRFLDLPTELRLMVYERLPIRTRHHTFKHAVFERKSERLDCPESAITLVERSFPIAILATCQLVHTEATPIPKTILERLRVEPWRIAVDSPSLGSFFDFQNPCFFKVVRYFRLNRTFTNSAVTARNIKYVDAQVKQSFGLLNPGQLRSLCYFFFAKCARFSDRRLTSSTLLVVVRRHPAEGPRALVHSVLRLLHDNSLKDMPPPVGFALWKDFTDDEDPPSHTHPLGLLREVLHNWAKPNLSVFQLEDFDPEEWNESGEKAD